MDITEQVFYGLVLAAVSLILCGGIIGLSFYLPAMVARWEQEQKERENK